MKLFRIIICLVALVLSATNCTTLQGAVELATMSQAEADAQAQGAATSAAAAGTPAPLVQPAPAGTSAAEQRRYYDAQLQAYKLASARKIKNSNNTTVEQTINATSPATLRTLLFVVFLFGGVVALVGRHYIVRGT